MESISDRATFVRLRSAGRRVRRGPVTVTWVPDVVEGGAPDDDLPGRRRVAYRVSRRVGRAVVRNRIRRRLRAVLQELGSDLPPGAYLVSAGRPAAAVPYDRLRASVAAAIATFTEPERDPPEPAT